MFVGEILSSFPFALLLFVTCFAAKLASFTGKLFGFESLVHGDTQFPCICSSGGAGGTYMRTMSCGDMARGVGVINVGRPITLNEQNADLSMENVQLKWRLGEISLYLRELDDTNPELL